jgi:hypothetical protein
MVSGLLALEWLRNMRDTARLECISCEPGLKHPRNQAIVNFLLDASPKQMMSQKSHNC